MNQNQKLILREQILNETCFLINQFYNDENNKISIEQFVEEVIKRSYTSFYTLRLTNIYLSKIIEDKKQVDICGKKLFIAALIVSTKVHLDNGYTNKAWLKIIGGLTIKEINCIEITFLKIMEYKLFVNIDKINKKYYNPNKMNVFDE